MSGQVERKLISICFLDLLHHLAVRSRAKPDEGKYLRAMVRAVEEIRKTDGFAGGNERISRIAGQLEWEKMLCCVFQIPALDNEVLTEVLYYYPSPRSITKLDYDTLLFAFGKASTLINGSDPDLVTDYMDAVHEMPEALKSKIDRKFFYKGFVLPFKKKWPDFFASDELEALKAYSLSCD